MPVKHTSNLDNLRNNFEKAAIAGTDRLMAHCVNDSKRLVNVDTGSLQGGIKFEPATIENGRPHGVWGVYDINYAADQEFGPHGKPYLRPSAKRNYPNLTRYIREEFNG